MGVRIGGDLGDVPCLGLLVANDGFDELPGVGGMSAAGSTILVPARWRLGVKNVVWDPPASRRIVEYNCKADPVGE